MKRNRNMFSNEIRSFPVYPILCLYSFIRTLSNPSYNNNTIISMSSFRGGGRSRRGGRGGQRNSGPMGGRRKNAGRKNPGSSKGGKAVYVGNLAWSVTWQQLKDHIRSLGFNDVRVEVMTNADSSRSKGWGLLTFENSRQATLAIRKVHDTELHDRLIFAREDKEEGTSGVDNRSIYVGNLPWEVRWQDLKDKFSSFGPIEYADVATKGGVPGGRSYGWGTVRYKSEASARKAIKNMNGRRMDGRDIEVRLDNKSGGQMSGASNASGGGTGGSGSSRGGGKGTGALYVGNLPWDVTWQMLKDAFRKFGNIEFAEVATEGGREGGRSKGWGTVRYTDAASARKAIKAMNGRVMDGRAIEVRHDEKNKPVGGAASSFHNSNAKRGGGKTGGGDAGNSLYVGNLPWEVTWQLLKDAFRKFGNVEFAEIATEGGREGGRSKGWGTVRYTDSASAKKAIKAMNGRVMDGRELEVRHDSKKQ